MTFQPGQTYRMKTYKHNFLDTVVVIAVYTENGSKTVIVERSNGQIVHLTERDIAGADYYLLDDDSKTDVEDIDDDDDDEDIHFYPEQTFVIF